MSYNISLSFGMPASQSLRSRMKRWLSIINFSSPNGHLFMSSFLRSSWFCSSGWPGFCAWSAPVSVKTLSVLRVLHIYAVALQSPILAVFPTQLTTNTTMCLPHSTHSTPRASCKQQAMLTTCPHRVTVLTTMGTCCTLASQAWTRPRHLHCWSTRPQGTAYQVVSFDQGLPAHHSTCPHISAVHPLHQRQTWMPLDAPVRSQVVLVVVHVQQPVAVEESHSCRLSWMRCVTLLSVLEPRMKVTV